MAAPMEMLLLLVQDVTATQATPQGATGFRNFWNVIEQAGPLRWPIFAVLGVGLILVISKLYELLRDRSASAALLGTDYRAMSLKDITALVSKQRESMLALLQSTMLNVFHTRPSEGMLHDEITNFVSSQQDQFGVFRRRMEFLSDTAGALGLMGTVWGMFAVFFQGTSDRDVILRGMGIALITTLLGLVVSIILNLSATELSTFFEKRIDRIAKKSDELRFRLLELAAATAAANGMSRPAAPQQPVSAKAAVEPPPSPPKRPEAPSRGEPKAAAKPEPAAPEWVFVETQPDGYAAKAGEIVRGLEVRALRDGGKPAGGTTVSVTLPADAGTLADGGRELKRATDASGILRFDWQAPHRAGAFVATAAVTGRPGTDRHIDLRVTPGAPHRVERAGNNQAAVAGMKLPQPLGVHVHDQFDNPVPGVAVHFKVKAGQGRLGQHGKEARVTTDEHGVAAVPFAVSSEAGPNAVTATVDGQERALEFVAFGTEL
jgi:biopolymer transport protein ExbB/TolQ